MAEEKIGSPIGRKLVEQIEARKKIVGKTVGRTSEDLLYLNSKTAWIRLSSSVNTITDEEAVSFVEQRGRGNIKGDNKLAGFNILQGGLLSPGRGVREGINTTTSYSENTAYNNRVNSTGIRPMPGITGLTVASKNTYGTLREAEVEISVWTLEDFEIIERIYLRPGFTMLLEWGHTMFVKNNGQLEKNIRTVGNKFFRGAGMSQLLREIKEIREESDYNYEGMIGYVKNINWEYTQDGCYKCKVSIISSGEILDSLKSGFNPKMRGIDKSEFAPSSDKEGKEQRKSPFHFLLSKLEEISRPRFTGKVSLREVSPSLGDRLEDFTGYYKEVQYEDHPDSRFYRDKTIKHYWLPLRVYLDFFNKFVTLVDTDKEKDSEDYATVKFNTDYEKSSKFITIPEHFSIDPTVCVLAHEHTMVERKGLAQNQKLRAANFGKVDNVMNNLVEPPNGYDDVLNILVASPFVKGILDSALNEDFEFTKGATEIFKEILSGISTALGGINDLDLYFDEDTNTFFIIDRNNTPRVKSPELTIAGIDSVFTNINVSSIISNQVGSQIAIAAQGSAQSFTENVENILKWNPNVIDRVRPEKDFGEIEVKEGQEELEKEKEKQLEEWYEDVINFFIEFNGTGYQDSDMQAAKSMFKEHITYLLYYQNTEKGNSPQGPVPVELSIQLEGIGGFKIASTFAIKSGILPAKYQNKFGYIITGLSHSISNNRWLTDIKTQFYLIEKGEPRGIPAGQERIFPVIDPAGRSDIPTSKTVGGTSRVIEGVKYTNGEVPDDKLRFINNWQSYKGAIGSDRGRVRLYTKASLALDQLLAAAESQNIKFKVNSAYRTYSDQVETKRVYGANAATPGRSNHGFGLAVDFANPSLAKLNTSMIQYKWLLANAAKYGFKRLPWGSKGENWEAWHWEYQI